MRFWGNAVVASRMPGQSVSLNRGETTELYTSGPWETPGDFYISAKYMSPVEQFLRRHVVLVPMLWECNYLAITCSANTGVLLDGELVDDALFVDVAKSDYQVARVPVQDGVHTIMSAESKRGINVLVVGNDSYSSYAYPGGMGLEAINIILE
ncbi:MAG: IgGFc-binding protein [Deltaproteobacteria bacterium]|nr:IgGFc-binding protein [Deltaproteobacteria bacterium]